MPRPCFPTQRFSSHARSPADARSPTHWSNRASTSSPAHSSGRADSPPAPTVLLSAVTGALRQVVASLSSDASVTVSADENEIEDQAESSSSSGAPVHADAVTQTIRVDDPNDDPVRVRVSVSPLRMASSPNASTQTAYAVTVGIDGGPLVRYTTRPPGTRTSDSGTPPPDPPLVTLRHKAEGFLRRELRTRLNRTTSLTATPRLTLDDEGRIQSLSPAARRALEYAPDAAPAPNFFSHVAGDNLGRVLRDLGRMVQGDCQHARWLVRLRTGTGRWRWYRAEVRNELATHDAITITVWSLGTTSSEQP